MSVRLALLSPSAAVRPVAPVRRALKRLQSLGFETSLDEAALARQQGLAGSDAERLAAIRRVAAAAPDVAMPTMGGHGLGRLLEAMPWRRLARSIEGGTRWVGRGDFTALQLGLLAHTGAASWAGPMAISEFGRSDAEGGVDEVTRDCFVEAMDGSLEAVGFRTAAGFDGLGVRGMLWGGHLTTLLSLLGTPHWPAAAARAGVLFLEDDGCTPQALERGLLQLRQAGVLQAQRAVLLGHLPGLRPALLDLLRHGLKTPLLPGLPMGEVQTMLTLPVGRRVQLMVQGREVLIAW